MWGTKILAQQTNFNEITLIVCLHMLDSMFISMTLCLQHQNKNP